MSTHLVDIVFPCFNEAEALPWVLGRLPDGYRAIVVDNASTDDSAAVATALGATVVHESRRGFGSAAHAGLMAATAPIVAFCDADASMDPSELPRLVAVLEADRADIVLGRRRPTARGAWSPHARVANIVLAWMLRASTGYRLRDLGPMRVARREALLELGIEDRRSGYPLEMVLRARRARWRAAEIDTAYIPRVGKSKVTGTLRGTIIAINDMSRLLLKIRPTKSRGRQVALKHAEVLG